MKKIRWSDAEDNVIRSTYPTGSWEDLCLSLPLRTRATIEKRASDIGAKRRIITVFGRHSLTTWSKDEDDILRKLYPCAPWAKLLFSLPGRDRKTIAKRTTRIGVLRNIHEFDNQTRLIFAEIVRTKKPRLGTGVKATFVDGVEGKDCTACEKWMPIENFSVRVRSGSELRNECSCCGTTRAKGWNRKHPDRAIASARRWQRKNPDKCRVIRRASRRTRNGKKLLGKVTAAENRSRWEEFHSLCGYCLSPATTDDHMEPLSGNGKHEIGNIVPACRRCNYRKGKKTLLGFLTYQHDTRG